MSIASPIDIKSHHSSQSAIKITAVDLNFPYELVKHETKERPVIKTNQKANGVLETDLDEILVDDGTQPINRTSCSQPSISSSTEDLATSNLYPAIHPIDSVADVSSSDEREEEEEEASVTIELTPAEIHQHSIKINLNSVIISYIVIAGFICILWLVVFLIFGYKGHTIAGVFVALFFVALLINTCLLKCYFRLQTLLGLSGALAIEERRAMFLRRQRKIKARMARRKSKEDPPSYSNVVSAPPRYSFLQFYKSKKSFMSMNSLMSERQNKRYKCPFCRREVLMFGICKSCKSNIQK